MNLKLSCKNLPSQRHIVNNIQISESINQRRDKNTCFVVDSPLHLNIAMSELKVADQHRYSMYSSRTKKKSRILQKSQRMIMNSQVFPLIATLVPHLLLFVFLRPDLIRSYNTVAVDHHGEPQQPISRINQINYVILIRLVFPQNKQICAQNKTEMLTEEKDLSSEQSIVLIDINNTVSCDEHLILPT